VARDPYQSIVEVSGRSNGERLLEVHQVACDAAIRKDAETIRHALALLRSTLQPAHAPELALSLMAVYEDIGKAVEKEDFATAAGLLEELRGLWKARIRIESFRQ